MNTVWTSKHVTFLQILIISTDWSLSPFFTKVNNLKRQFVSTYLIMIQLWVELVMPFKQVFRLNKMKNLPRKKGDKLIRKKRNRKLMIRVSSCSQNKFSVSYGTYYIKDPLDKVVTDRDGSVRHTNWYEAICSFTPLSSSAALRRA